ncbi:tetratricopeptide repeat-containing protein [Cystoisospora suis]|uniref:Tetratricopeptide repeat-containing protein n=1 Tax=Cystoisospora suis TaxID=483139 RepID=A0A2C6KKD1_9APIC|nr:tetratricopeptide repeat-containing protein [Cystoisospora suis]
MSKTRLPNTGSNALPSKEHSLFKNMVYLYEHKHFKKAFKQADLILKKVPEHGETLSMKGLILSNIRPDKKQEAYDLAKRGLRADLKNYVCWHVLGLIYRADKDYFEAAKCFSQAVRLSPGNFQILRDLSNLQIHERNLEGFRETRRQILAIRSQHIREWTAFALANHLCGSLDVAHDLLAEVEKQFEDASDMDAFDKSEIILYSASILEQSGRLEDCLGYLKEREQKIVDKVSMLEMEGRLALQLGRHGDARDAYAELFRRNKDNEVYALCLLACHPDQELSSLCRVPVTRCSNSSLSEAACVEILPGSLASTGEGRAGWLLSPETLKAFRRLSKQIDRSIMPLTGWKRRRNSTPVPLFVITRMPTEAEQDKIIRFFKDLTSEHSKCSLPSYLVLSFLTGERLRVHLDAFLRPALRKGVVSLFSSLRRLYTPERVPLITALLESYVYHLEREDVATFGPVGGGGTADGSVALEVTKREDVNQENSQLAFLESPSGNTFHEKRPEGGEMPMCLVYTYMLLAQHYDFLGWTEKALAVVEKAIKHTPTLVDLYLVKGRIYKHAGAYAKACEWHEVARSLDLADRYLNTKACSYLLRVNRAEEAVNVAKLFSRQSDADGLHSMQCMWFEQKMGKRHMRCGAIGPALYEFNAVVGHFRDIKEDQFDFHPYCLRKSSYRAYVSFLRMQDKLASHAFFRRAARRSVRLYLALHDGDIDLAQAREKAKAEREAQLKVEVGKKKTRQQANNGQATASATDAAATKEDPTGSTFLEKNPLEAASEIVDQLLNAGATGCEHTHVLHYHIAARKKKTAAMLLACARLWRLTGQNKFARRLVPLLTHFSRNAVWEDLPESLREPAKEVMDRLFGLPVQDTSGLRAAGDQYWRELTQACTHKPWDFKLRRAAVEALTFTKQAVSADLPFLAFQAFPAGRGEDALRLEGMPTLRECEQLFEALVKHDSARPTLESLKAICRQRFPLAEAFA